MKHFKCLALLLLSVCTFMLSGCGDSPEDRVPKDAISFALNTEPASLDPAMTTGLPESTAELALFEGLTRLDENSVPQPALAESWEISEDGMTYIFHLRDGICWSDGTPITPNDFVSSWLRVLDPAIASGNAYMLFSIKNAEEYNSEKAYAEDVGIEALDDKSIKVTLKEPSPYFLGLTAFHALYPIPVNLAAANQDGWASEAKGILGCGPYKIVSWKHASEITFEKNEKYWNAANVKPQYLRMPISESNATRLAMVESGQTDMMESPPSADEKRMTEMGMFKVFPMLGTRYYVINTAKAPFDKLEVRKAFAQAVEREALIKNVVRGGKEPAYNFVPLGMMINNQDFAKEAGNIMPENPAGAKDILAKSGYNGEEITILYATGDFNKAVSEALQDMWKRNLGVTAELANQETKVFYANRDEGEYQIAFASWVADFADPMNFLDCFWDKNNEARYNNPAFITAVDKAKAEVDNVKRAEYMHEAEKILLNDYVLIPVFYSNQNLIVNPNLKGYICSPMGTIDFIHAYRD